MADKKYTKYTKNLLTNYKNNINIVVTYKTIYQSGDWKDRESYGKTEETNGYSYSICQEKKAKSFVNYQNETIKWHKNVKITFKNETKRNLFFCF